MRCERCAGLVVAEHASVGGPSIGCGAFGEWRCVNCGAVGVSAPVSGHPVAQAMAGKEKVGVQRRALNTEPRRS